MPTLKSGQKIDLKPKKHHGFYLLLFLLGLLLPPLAVAARFGIGTDFFINVFLCICGYFPCHFHNFYIQNIRNNTNRARTPKWALKAGLVDDSDRQRRLKKNAWAKRFDERNLESTHVGAPLEDGEEGANYDPLREQTEEERNRQRNEGLWTRGEEEYYNEEANAPNQKSWHYPANFEGTVGDGRSKSRKSNSTAEGDRWERSRSSRQGGGEDQFYPTNHEAGLDADVPEWGKDYGSKKKSKKSKTKGGSANAWASNNYVQDIQDDNGWGRSSSRGSGGGRNTGGGGGGGGGYGNGNGYGNGGGGYDEPRSNGNAAGAKKKQGGDIFEHEF